MPLIKLFINIQENRSPNPLSLAKSVLSPEAELQPKWQVSESSVFLRARHSSLVPLTAALGWPGLSHLPQRGLTSISKGAFLLNRWPKYFPALYPEELESHLLWAAASAACVHMCK